jgi:hypothetical protein
MLRADGGKYYLGGEGGGYYLILAGGGGVWFSDKEINSCQTLSRDCFPRLK